LKQVDGPIDPSTCAHDNKVFFWRGRPTHRDALDPAIRLSRQGLDVETISALSIQSQCSPLAKDRYRAELSSSPPH
jgi:gamma-glutamyltranspeptidase